MVKFLPLILTLFSLLGFPLSGRADVLLKDFGSVYWFNEAEENADEKKDEKNFFSSLFKHAPITPPSSAIQEEPHFIALVIDDAGLDKKRTHRALALLPPEVTFAYLPYSAKIEAQTKQARAKGHEVIVHLPMEAEQSTLDAGPDYLDVTLSDEELDKRIEKNLTAFEGYVGVNNHMGSRFSTHRHGLERVMQALKKRGVFFLDSRTTAKSLGATIAHETGLATAQRDIFLDDTNTEESVTKQLKTAERLARKKGLAIVIGHPRDATLAVLEQWLPTLAERNIRLIPLSTAIHLRETERSVMGAR